MKWLMLLISFFNLGSNRVPIPPTAKGLIIPHHLAAENSIKSALKTFQSQTASPSSILFIAPNHKEIGNAFIISNEPGLIDFTSLSMLYNPEIINQEHAVSDSLPLINQSFPGIPIIPIILSSRLPYDQLLTLVQILTTASQKNILIIGSIDFSHYLSLAEADNYDKNTLDLITTRNYPMIRTLDNRSLDASPVLEVVMRTMDAVGAQKIEVLSHTNSGRLSGNPVAPTTSHFTLLFGI
jgi:MEMO1 family protein